MKKTALKVTLLAALLIIPELCSAQVVRRFPKPDFQTQYTQPEMVNPTPRSEVLEIIDVIALVAALSLASWFALKKRSRRKVFILMIISLIYFGFVRKGCICSVGSLQNVTYAFFQSSYAIPLTALAFFVIPLLFTLFLGRTFCAAVCPLGGIQDLVVLKPVDVPGWLAHILSIIPYAYLGMAVLFASAGAGFIICQYDPFVGIFRFGSSFNMIALGVVMLLLGTVVARPYCRFFCPYGVLLNWMSRLSKKHITITPDECNNCRLCEASCPFGAIHPPNEGLQPENKNIEIGRLAVLLVLLPVIVISSGWAVSRLHKPLSGYHFYVALAEEIQLEDSGQRLETTEESRAFLVSGKSADQLFLEAAAIRNHFRIGSWLLGGFLGLIISLKLIRFTIHKKRDKYEIDKGSCLSCARCASYCPYELVRLGIIKPEEITKHES
jgi:ferredoxin